MPTIVPRARGSQYGAPRPTNAGTRYTPSVSGDLLHQPFDVRRCGDRLQPVAQPLHRRAGDEHRPFERIGHVWPPICQPTVVSRPLCDGHRRLARIEQHEAAGAVGVLRRARLEARLPEERRLLIAGNARPPARPTPAAPDRSRRRPRSTIAPRAASPSAHRESSAARRPTRSVWMLKSSVRLALLTSVMWQLAAASAARSGTCRSCRTGSSPRAARARSPSCESSRYLIFVPEKYASTTRPVLRRNVASWPSALSRSQIGAVIRLCQTIALPIGRPLIALPQDGGLALVGNADRRQIGRRDVRGLRDGVLAPSRAAWSRSPRDRARRGRATETAAETPAARCPLMVPA